MQVRWYTSRSVNCETRLMPMRMRRVLYTMLSARISISNCLLVLVREHQAYSSNQWCIMQINLPCDDTQTILFACETFADSSLSHCSAQLSQWMEEKSKGWQCQHKNVSILMYYLLVDVIVIVTSRFRFRKISLGFFFIFAFDNSDNVYSANYATENPLLTHTLIPTHTHTCVISSVENHQKKISRNLTG